MSESHSTPSADSPITIIKLPLQRDENGKAVIYLDPQIIAKHMPVVEKTVEKLIEKPIEQPIETPKSAEKPADISNPFSPPKTPTTTPTPEQIFAKASESIFYQDTALKALSSVLYYHLEGKRQYQSDLELAYLFGGSMDNIRSDSSDYAQAPIFLTGKTGSGKTHIIKQLCKLYDVNFIAVNSSNLSNAGYKGYTLADVGASLMQSAKREKAKVEYSVVFFDEFDKLFLDTGQTANLGIYKRSLVTEILTIIEGTTPFPVREEDGIDSSKMLFILGGSFNMHQADEKANIGFMNKKTLQNTPDSQLKLTDFGLPDELAGRIGKIIAMQDIDDTEMIELLLNSPTSPYIAFTKKLAMVNCTVSIRPSALEALLCQQKEAIKKFGVRGMYQGFNELPQLVEILYDAPNFPKTHYIIKSDGFDVVRNEALVAEAKKAKQLEEQRLSEQALYDNIPF